MRMNSFFSKFDPAVDKNLLIIIAALIWGIVGVMLCNLASEWLTQTTPRNSFWLGMAGLALSLFIYHFGFLKIVRKNADRILALKDRICFFAFQPWRSCLIIVIMIALGITLRHSPLPKPYLAIIYIGFGIAMVLSCIKYLWIYLKTKGKLQGQ